MARQAVNMAVPLLVSALARFTSSPQGANTLSSVLTQNFSGAAGDDPAAALSSGQPAGSGAMDALLAQVLGGQGQAQAVETALGSATGVDAKGLLALVGPVILGYLGKTQRDQGLDATGLATQLQGAQQDMAASGDLMGTVTSILGAGQPSTEPGGLGGLLGKLFGR
jgi:hypothetical protein